jgi:hypothetical protein
MTTPRKHDAGLAAMVLLPHVLLTLVICMTGLTLLIYAGIALPAIWSARPARRKAAAAVLSQVLALIPATSRRPPRDN